ncbi:protein adenylyltransferase SelO [Paenarthrobacter sp. NPDC089316]|uniref:protein adenylyltransferase SelO n=1 Tax=unclassified Paenarthrobacter TaxID=2634190 RepID=UPI0034313821
MSDIAPSTIAFEGKFAREFPELAVPWRAEEAPDPQLLVLNRPLAVELGFDPGFLQSPEGVRLLIGNALPEDATPVAQGYAGHQFGWYSPRLGDGRALLLGEVADEDGKLRDIHLKGSGRTPFARNGDGQAVVGPMLREYIVSESMHALHIPTTRSLAVVATGRSVQRETMLPGAVLTRVASSHLRVGSFQYARASDDMELLRRLADHAIERHHPASDGEANRYLALLKGVIAVQARLVAQWMLVGFVHGVMNTDNMTVSGETIDYGPCAFMDGFDPGAVYSSIDEQGRYAYRNQPVVAEWNLARFAESLVPLIHEDEEQGVALAVEALGGFRQQYSAAWFGGMLAKLGLPQDIDDAVSSPLVDDLLGLVQEARADYTSFFRNLSKAARGDVDPARGAVLDLAAFDDWLERWKAAAPDADAMDRVNPAYIPRNHLVEEALAAATSGDMGPAERLLEAVSEPFVERPGMEKFAEPAPDSFGPYRTFCGT